MFAIQIPTVFSLSCHACLIKHLNKPVHIYLVFWLLHFYTWVSISSLQELVLPHYLTGKLLENFFLCCPSLGEHLFTTNYGLYFSNHYTHYKLHFLHIPMHGHSGYYDSMWLNDSGPIKGTPWLYTSPVDPHYDGIQI